MALNSLVLADVFKGIALFSFAGPPIGTLFFLATLAVPGGGANPGALLWFFFLAAYALTLPLAAATGLVAGILRSRLDQFKASLVTIATSTLIAPIYIEACFNSGSPHGMALIFCGAALVASGACSFIFFRPGRQ